MSKHPNPSRWTVRKYFDEIYLPWRAESRGVALADQTAKWYRHAIHKVDSILGHPVQLHEATSKLLGRVANVLRKENCSERTVQKVVEAMRVILRHWKPKAFQRSPVATKPTRDL